MHSAASSSASDALAGVTSAVVVTLTTVPSGCVTVVVVGMARGRGRLERHLPGSRHRAPPAPVCLHCRHCSYNLQIDLRVSIELLRTIISFGRGRSWLSSLSFWVAAPLRLVLGVFVAVAVPVTLSV